MRPHLYVLNDNGEPEAILPNSDDFCGRDEALVKWGKFFEQTEKRRVCREIVNGVTVSTVFLGMDHSWGDGPPILWETMVFCSGHPLDQDMMRCAGSREQAEAMHRNIVEKVKRLAMKEG